MNEIAPKPTPPLNLRSAQKKYPHMAVPSPCIGVCKMDDKANWCVGCYRSLDEIASWSRLADDQKRALWTEVESRQHGRTLPVRAVSGGGV